jgi:hypothetical protein
LEEVFGALKVYKGSFGALECARADFKLWRCKKGSFGALEAS